MKNNDLQELLTSTDEDHMLDLGQQIILDVLVLCAFSKAVDLRIAEQVVIGLETDIRDCIKRAHTNRIRLDTNAQQLLYSL